MQTRYTTSKRYTTINGSMPMSVVRTGQNIKAGESAYYLRITCGLLKLGYRAHIEHGGKTIFKPVNF